MAPSLPPVRNVAVRRPALLLITRGPPARGADVQSFSNVPLSLLRVRLPVTSPSISQAIGR
jgi:hypothetical protein